MDMPLARVRVVAETSRRQLWKLIILKESVNNNEQLSATIEEEVRGTVAKNSLLPVIIIEAKNILQAKIESLNLSMHMLRKLTKPRLALTAREESIFQTLMSSSR